MNDLLLRQICNIQSIMQKQNVLIQIYKSELSPDNGKNIVYWVLCVKCHFRFSFIINFLQKSVLLLIFDNDKYLITLLVF